MDNSPKQNITRDLVRAILLLTHEQRYQMKINSICHNIDCTFTERDRGESNDTCRFQAVSLFVSNDSHQEEIPTWNQLARIIHLYIYPLFILMGIFGNSLSCLIMLINVRRARAYPASLYLTLLAFVDCLFLLGSALPDWISQLNPRLDIKNYSDFSCRFVYWFGHFMTHLSAGLVVGVTIERFIAVQYPLIAHKINTITRTRLALLILLLFFFILDSPVFILVRQIREHIHSIHTCYNDTNVRYTRHDVVRCGLATERYERTWVYIDCIVYTLIPFFIIMTLNSLIIRRLIDAQRFRQHMFRLSNSTSSRYDPSETNKNRTYSDSHQAIELMEKPVRQIRFCQSMTETRPLATMLRPRVRTSFSNFDERRRRYHQTKHSSISTEFSSLSFELKMRSQHHSDLLCTLRQQKSLDYSRANHTRLTILLLFVSCSFLILTLPAVVFNLILSTKMSSRSTMVNKNLSSSIINETTSTDNILYYTLARLFMIINHSINFILYLLLGKRFRRDLKQFFLSYWRKLNRRRRRRR